MPFENNFRGPSDESLEQIMFNRLTSCGDHQCRTHPCFRFGSVSEIVPTIAYVVMTVLPLLHGMTHSA